MHQNCGQISIKLWCLNDQETTPILKLWGGIATLGWDHEPGKDMYARPKKNIVLHRKGSAKVKPRKGFWIVLWVNWFLNIEKGYSRTAAQADDYVCSIQWSGIRMDFILTWTTSSSKSTSNTGGTTPAPIPWIQCEPFTCENTSVIKVNQ